MEAMLRSRLGRRDQGGFTLIELIIVIAIIGILVAIAIPVYGGIQYNAKEKAVAGSATSAYHVARSYEADKDPSTTTATAASEMSNEKILITVEPSPYIGNADGICMSAEWRDATAGLAKVYSGDC